MLYSQKEERERQFSLALRAGVPLLILIFLVFYTTLNHSETFTITIRDGILIAAITFIAVYFIYFLINLSVEETLLDETTQVFNKRTFLKKLQTYEPKSLACLNIENLMSLSENYSGDQIDNLLYTISSTLSLILKQNGLDKALIGRGRGSEFFIALNSEADINIEAILEKLIEENGRINNIDVNYKFSVIINPNEDFQKAIVQLRDIIASQSKDNRKQSHTHSVKDAQELSSIEKDVISTIQKKKLLLTFRPLFNVSKETIDTYEIAVKLRSETHQDILPRVYLPIVNRLGLGREYDLTLIKHVIDLLPLVDNISFTFNLSPFSLRDSDFQEKVFAYLEEKQVDPSRLIIQLYERKTHHDLSGYLNTLKKFRSHGIKICIDNFGSSNASMEYMKHFKFDMVQFDRDYVTHLEDSTTYAMLHSLINMSKELQVETVAKWVDNEEQKENLRRLGIDYIQGFGVSKPVDEETLINRYN